MLVQIYIWILKIHKYIDLTSDYLFLHQDIIVYGINYKKIINCTLEFLMVLVLVSFSFCNLT